jgi:hypothetical protein
MIVANHDLRTSSRYAWVGEHRSSYEALGDVRPSLRDVTKVDG